MLLGLTLCIGTANAREARATIGVNATVNAVARLELQTAPSTIDISATDVRRGWVEVPDPTSFVIRSNSPEGFALDLTAVAPLMTSLVVHGLDGDLALGADGGTIVQRWQHRNVATISLKFRLLLAPGVGAGRYPWPLRVAARPL